MPAMTASVRTLEYGRRAHRPGTRLAAGAAVLLAACSHRAPPPTPPPPKVSVVTVQGQAVRLTTELPGRVAAYRAADVRPQVSGIILKRLFIEGTEVKAGQQLYLIDPAPYEATYHSAIAGEASARALAERYKPLAEANAVSKQDYDNAVASHLQAQATVETARINLIYTKVLSPITGRIGRTLVTEGQLVTANQSTALTTIQQLDPVYVDVTQPSTTLLRIRREAATGMLKQNAAGQTQVQLRLEDGSAYDHTGTLESSEVTVDVGTGSVTLRALMPNPERLLLPGMFVREQLEEGSRQDALLVPQQGVSHNQKGEATSLVIGPDNTVELRTLQTDRAVGDKWVVTAGLKPGDRVIVEGLQSARPGSKVQPEEYQSSAPDEKTVRQAVSTDQSAAPK
jgi:membrane fusion protein, multidrug efflux system